MPQYLVAVQYPENYDPSLEGEAMIRDIGALNEEMDAARCQVLRWRPGTGRQSKIIA